MKFTVTRSFSTRISIYILLVTGAILCATFLVFYRSARKQVQIEAETRASVSLDNTVLRIDEVLHSVEVALTNNAWQVDRYIHCPDSMFSIARRLLESNSIIIGSAIAFEPDYYPEKGHFFSPYAYRNGDSIVCKQLGVESYDYHYMDWYQIPKLLDRPYWSEPYFDTGGGEKIMTTYSLPLHDSNGKLYAVFTADLSLEWLAQKVGSLKLYPDSYNLVIGRSGTYLVHPYPERILTETIFTATYDMKDTTVVGIGHRMIAGEKGFATIQNDSLSTSYIFYAPVERTGWSVAVACTYDDIFAGVDRIRNRIVIIAAAGLLLLLVFCLYTIRQLVHPLTRLANSIRNIAQGDLMTPLPPLGKRHDEMGMLYDSFGYMQHSLSEYMKELAATTANKERIESELRIASEIQMEMIPKIFPPFPERKDIDLFATILPAKAVGGDLYDFFVENDCLFFTVADVSGKGIPASLLMVVTRSLFRTMASHLKTPAAILSSLNDALSESNESGMFVTMFLGVLHLKTGVLAYCNAGHNPPVFFTQQEQAHFLQVTPNIPLGLFHGFNYTEQELTLTADASLFLYTDGVTEAENPDKQLFSEERLLKELDRLSDGTPTFIVNQMMEAIHSHAAGAEQSDDITMLCLHYLPQ